MFAHYPERAGESLLSTQNPDTFPKGIILITHLAYDVGAHIRDGYLHLTPHTLVDGEWSERFAYEYIYVMVIGFYYNNKYDIVIIFIGSLAVTNDTCTNSK